jgi:hypothetical protein
MNYHVFAIKPASGGIPAKLNIAKVIAKANVDLFYDVNQQCLSYSPRPPMIYDP